MASGPPKTLVEMEGVVVNSPLEALNLESMVSQPPDSLAGVGDTVTHIPRDGKKRRRASSSGVRSESLICMALSRKA
jgi:hypothetical protein